MHQKQILSRCYKYFLNSNQTYLWLVVLTIILILYNFRDKQAKSSLSLLDILIVLIYIKAKYRNQNEFVMKTFYENLKYRKFFFCNCLAIHQRTISISMSYFSNYIIIWWSCLSIFLKSVIIVKTESIWRWTIWELH